MFDEEPKGEHDECAHEIHRLQAQLTVARSALERIDGNGVDTTWAARVARSALAKIGESPSAVTAQSNPTDVLVAPSK